MADAPTQTSYTLRNIQSMLGISRAVVASLVQAGFVVPTRGRRNEQRFTFKDVVLLRMAHGLQVANIPPRKIVRSLQRLRAALPHELPLTGLHISAVGSRIAVRDGLGQWEADTGQLFLAFEIAPANGAVAFLPAPADPKLPAPDPIALQAGAPGGANPEACFTRAAALEAADAPAAETAYRQALRLAPGYVDAYLNLGAMLCETRRCGEAVELYDQALRHCPDDPQLHFNRAVALEDQGAVEAALADYERSLQLAPDMADAHFNAGRLHERLGNAQGAVRHFSAYRRLER